MKKLVLLLLLFALATIERQKIDPDGTLWQAVKDVTRQGEYMGYEPLVKG